MKIKISGVYILLIGWCLFNINQAAQAQTEKEKKTPRINLAYHQLNDDLPYLQVDVKTKNGRRFEPVEGVDINVFFGEETAGGFMGRTITNDKGIGVVNLDEKFSVQWDTLPSSTFIATLTANNEYEDASAEVEIAKSRIELTLETEDSVRTMKAKVMAQEDGNWIPVPETEIKFVVKRLLSNLQAGEEASYYSDEEGTVMAEFTSKVPGDVDGNIILGAKFEDNELYGNRMVTKQVKWGVPLKVSDSFGKRTLWSTRSKTPYWLLIFPNLAIACVWGAIVYLIFLIIKIKKIGKANP